MIFIVQQLAEEVLNIRLNNSMDLCMLTTLFHEGVIQLL